MLVTKQIKVHMSHKLSNYNGLCSNIHGHTYLIEVGVEGNIIKEQGTTEGMVMDFGTLKNIMLEVIDKPFDHSCVIYKKDSLVDIFRLLAVQGQKINFVDYNPTAENYAKEWFKLINDKLKEEVTLQLNYIKVWETDTAFATYTIEDFKKDKLKGQKLLSNYAYKNY